MPDGVGEVGLARRCVDALRALKEADGDPSPGQRTRMAGWAGWGPLSKTFGWNAKPGAWEEISGEVGRLLTREELSQARGAVDTAFYTPRPVVTAAWNIMTGLGFTGGEVLEPGCGAGYFMAGTPAGLPVEWTGVETDSVSAQIAAAVHPGAKILHGRLEKTPLLRGSFDAVIGNVPFSQAGPYDPTAPDGLNLHNYFIWRSLSACRPGGLVVLVTSRWTLDAENTGQRQELAALGDFIGAVRMPGTALAAGGTTAVADIVVFRRRAGAAPDGDPDPWLRRPAPGGQVTQSPVSPYWLASPGMVCGTMRDASGGMHHARTVEVVPPPGVPLPEILAGPVAALVAHGTAAGLTWQPPADLTAVDLGEDAETAASDGTYTLHPDGSVTQQQDGRQIPVRASAELADLVGLKQAALALFAAEADLAMGHNERNRIRQETMRLYQAYTARYGYLNRSDLSERTDADGDIVLTRRRPSMGGFRKDPDYVTVLALEIWDDDCQAGKPAPILLRHVNQPAQRKEHASDPGEALLLCLDIAGRVDLEVIARILRTDPARVPGLLEGQIWEDPADRGTWLDGDEYLSGDVRARLAVAERAAAADRRWLPHVTALRQVQPADLTPEQISVQLGSPWIPPADIERFIADLLWPRESWNTAGCGVGVNFAPLTSAWEVHASTAARQRPAARAQWGTMRVNAVDLIQHALNGTTPTVYDVDGTDTKIRNVVETQLAADRIRDLQERFAEWLWEDSDRAGRLAALYNKRFNSVRLRSYDGSMLTFPGLDAGFTPRQSQRDMVRRMICTPASLCGFTMGGGKTAIMILGAMKLGELGLARKPAMIVPNHLLEQETAEARRMYPGARILMVTKEDLSRERRKAFAAKVAARQWDLVIMTHQQFMALPVSEAVQAEYLAGLIAELDEAISDDALEQTRTAKDLARKRKKLVAQHEKLLDAPRDDGLTWEQTGIDLILYDEAHACKNLQFSARAEGFSTAGSKRADDLMMKICWLRSRNRDGRCCGLFTGTPVSNALSELWVILKYLMPGRLAELGLAGFDGFAGQHIRYATQTEVAPDGSGFRSHRRPVRYANLPELRLLLGTVADIRTKADLQLPGPKVTVRHIAVPAQPELAGYTAGLVQRADDIRGGKVDRQEDNMLSVCTDGRRAALDLRLVGIDPTGHGKVRAAAENIAAIYHATKDNVYPDPAQDGAAHPRRGALQMAFCDQGTPSADRGDQVYGWMRDYLTELGVPAGLIAFIHDAKTDGDKTALFARCRNGEVAVLLGSTDKCGTGVNIQTRMTDVQHIDAPWTPAAVGQRDGRCDRPGNCNEAITIWRYVTERSFDAYMWQALERKAGFIEQILTGSLNAREVEDFGGGQVLSFAELKAIATGQPLLLELAKINAEIARLRQAKAAHSRMQGRMSEDFYAASDRARDADNRAGMLARIAQAGEGALRELVRGGQAITGSEDIAAELGRVLQYARDRKTRAEVGRYRGVYVSVEPVFYAKGAPVLTVRLETAAHSRCEHSFRAAVKPWKAGGAAALLAQIDQVIGDAARLAGQASEVAAADRARAEEFRPYLNQAWPHTADLAAAVSYRTDLEQEIDAQVKGSSEAEPVRSAA